MDPFEERARRRLEDVGGVDIEAFSASFLLFRLATQYPGFLESTVHRPRGLSTAGFRVLFTVWVYDELEVRQIARLSGVSTAAVSGVLGTLEAKGLVDKRRDGTDRRLVRVQLSREGAGLLTETYEAQNRVEHEMFAGIEGLDDLSDLMRDLLATLTDGKHLDPETHR
ncbi:MAG: MarR family transcriptional regulator [Acidimicrobiia bacterium]|nr:MarR family transcriptional regulator [Acidimicrobiia bacterium]